ncbi:SMI1/KNR4 family protein [Pseudomonas sp. NPDC087612]|uniref:SMI1/KNR4 family protein n=1 Tax=Pseudomonas sp. NPDC087612 TaxID=3364441 RepID=UPI003813E0B2
MSLVETYLSGLRQALPSEELEQLNLAHGASAADLQKLSAHYPLCPDSLLRLLGQIDGTHFRDYPGGTVIVLVLGSDVFEYPYYLSASEQILEDARSYTDSIRGMYGEYLEEYPETVGAGIDSDLAMNQRLCFSHCMNNGGSSKLYIDFNPAAGGTVGQVVRYLHDPDSYEVIADSFDQYLQQLIADDFAFVEREI